MKDQLNKIFENNEKLALETEEKINKIQSILENNDITINELKDYLIKIDKKSSYNNLYLDSKFNENERFLEKSFEKINEKI